MINLRFKTILLVATFVICNVAIANNDKRPNIVVILADDLGYGDVQPLNQESKIATPNFNRLAKQGMTFTDAHSPSAVCTPTRYGLLCGRYPWRSSLKRGVLGGYSKPLIEPERQTIASVLKSAGYHTGCIGKWHLGLGWQWREKSPSDINNMGIAGGKSNLVDYSQPLTHTPNTLGFDYSFIVPASLDMSPYVYVRNDRATTIPDKVIKGKSFPAFYRKGEIAADFKMEDALDKLTEEASQFITKASQKDDPFFLYFPLTAPHKPVMPHSRFEKSTELGPYGDFITQVDWTIGQVLQSLDKNNLTENTLLIVTSDNGSFMRKTDKQTDHVRDENIQAFHPLNHTANNKFRGTKADIWEAGHRVPFFVQWPKRIEPITKTDQTVCHTDILATVAEVVKQKFDHKQSEDSHSFAAALAGKETERPPVIHHSGSGHLAIRDGKWKLVMSSGSGGREKPKGKAFEKPFALFDLDNDIEEKTNLIESEVKVADRLLEQFHSISHGDHLSSKK